MPLSLRLARASFINSPPIVVEPWYDKGFWYTDYNKGVGTNKQRKKAKKYQNEDRSEVRFEL